MREIKFLCEDCDDYYIRTEGRDTPLEIKDEPEVFLKDMQYGIICYNCGDDRVREYYEDE